METLENFAKISRNFKKSLKNFRQIYGKVWKNIKTTLSEAVTNFNMTQEKLIIS